VATIAPFLQLDRDPYMVIADGRLFWIQDAYTTSSYFPYAQRLPNASLNYIRNAVKVVIDAYNGTVDFYLVDPLDPIAATYQRIFLGLFKPFESMPQELQKHVRYPEDLFRIQVRSSTSRITWTAPRCSTIARISGNSPASLALAKPSRWTRTTSSCGCRKSRRRSSFSCVRWRRASART
jgi:hypothetical protein